MHKEKIKIVHETLLVLTQTSPADAYLVKMHLEGLNYRQMAERDIGNRACSEKEIRKKTDAIKKQFTRKNTGSLAKFKSCLERVMRKNQLIYHDMLN
jgi:RNA polymerase sigma-70 factor (ECF subfamily)